MPLTPLIFTSGVTVPPDNLKLHKRLLKLFITSSYDHTIFPFDPGAKIKVVPLDGGKTFPKHKIQSVFAEFTVYILGSFTGYVTLWGGGGRGMFAQ
jgi:hypothetical protein